MKKIWKVLGITALAAVLTPYRYEVDEKTGEKKLKALLWSASSNPNAENKDKLTLNIGFNKPAKEDEESHLFCDELIVDYGDTSDGGTTINTFTFDETGEEAAPESPAENPQEEEAPVENEAPEEPKEPKENEPEKPQEAENPAEN